VIQLQEIDKIGLRPGMSMGGNEMYTAVGRLVSQTSCLPKYQPVCLSFRYAFDFNAIIRLRVVLVDDAWIMYERRLLWLTFSSESRPADGTWDIAMISFSPANRYNVLFEAKRLDDDLSHQYSVYIDDIQFVPLPCDVYQTSARTEQTSPFPSATTNANVSSFLNAPRLSTTSAPKDEGSPTTSSGTTITSLIVTIVLLVLAGASVALAVFCRWRSRLKRESTATSQARAHELKLRPLHAHQHGGDDDGDVIVHQPDAHGSLESVYNEIPISWSPDDGVNPVTDHYDLPNASAERGDQLAAASLATDNAEAPSLPNRVADHYDLPNASAEGGNQRSDYLTPCNDLCDYLQQRTHCNQT
jgi:hypothetical protein